MRDSKYGSQLKPVSGTGLKNSHGTRLLFIGALRSSNYYISVHVIQVYAGGTVAQQTRHLLP
jgi:hypothetical protein